MCEWAKKEASYMSQIKDNKQDIKSYKSLIRKGKLFQDQQSKKELSKIPSNVVTQ